MDQIEEQTLCKEEYQNVNSYHEILIGTNFFIYIPHHAEYTRFLTLHTHLLYIIHAFSHFTHTTTIQYTRFLTLHTHTCYTVYTLSHTSHTHLLYSIHAFSHFTHTPTIQYTRFLSLHTHNFKTLYTLPHTSHTLPHLLYIIHAFSHFPHTFYTFQMLSYTSHTHSIHYTRFLSDKFRIAISLEQRVYPTVYYIYNKFRLVHIPHCILYI